MEAILTFVAKYWAEFILAGIGTFVIAQWRKFKKTYSTGQNVAHKEQFAKDLEPYKEELRDRIKEEVTHDMADLAARQDMAEKTAEGRMKVYLEHEKLVLDKIKEMTEATEQSKMTQLEREAAILERVEEMTKISDERRDMYLEHEKMLLERIQEIADLSEQRKNMFFEHEQGIFSKIDELDEKFTSVIDEQNTAFANALTQMDKKSQERGEESRKRDEMTLHAVLYLQKKEFLHNCEKLLAGNHEITFEEYGSIQKDYDLYKSLGGNGQGDTYMKAIEQKYQDAIRGKK